MREKSSFDTPNEACEHDELFLQRAFELAWQVPLCQLKTNPRVGAVVVKNKKIIAEGAHQHFGKEHAEVTALSQISSQEITPETTLYVTLEPCNHFGKTPPCTELIIQKKVARVVVGCLDPNPLTFGSGINKLQSEGIQVVLSKNPALYQVLIKPFWINQVQKRPFVILKWAQSTDGFIARPASRTAISGYESQIQTHYLRSQVMAILIGGNTARIDSPQLNNRFFSNNLLQPIIWSNSGNFPVSQYQIPPIVISEEALQSHKLLKITPEESMLDWLKRLLKVYQVSSVLVEGGAQVLNQFIAENLWDEAFRITAPIKVHAGINAPAAELFNWQRHFQLGQDLWEKASNNHLK